MHIVAILTAAIGIVLAVLWRLNSAAQAARGLAETAEEAHGFWRRWSWRSRLANDPLTLAKDPREIGSAMLVAIAQADGAITANEQRTITTQMIRYFDVSEAAAAELLAHARWLTREVRDPGTALLKLFPRLTPDVHADALAMLNAVAEADGAPGDLVKDALERLRRSLRVP